MILITIMLLKVSLTCSNIKVNIISHWGNLSRVSVTYFWQKLTRIQTSDFSGRSFHLLWESQLFILYMFFFYDRDGFFWSVCHWLLALPSPTMQQRFFSAERHEAFLLITCHSVPALRLQEMVRSTHSPAPFHLRRSHAAKKPPWRMSAWYPYAENFTFFHLK